MSENLIDTNQYLCAVNSLKEKITRSVDVEPHKEKEYCLELIELAMSQQDNFNIGFSYVWLADYYFFVERDIEMTNKYLSLAYGLLKDSKDTILMKYYVLKSLVFEKDDEYIPMLRCQLSIRQLTKETGDETYLGTYYANVGSLFKACNDFDEALRYYQLTEKEFDRLEDKSTNLQYLIHLTKMIECYCAINDESNVEIIMNKINKISDEVPSKEMVIPYVQMLYYALKKDKDKIIENVEIMIDKNMLHYPKDTLRYQLIIESMRCLLIAKNEKYARIMFDAIDNEADRNLRDNIDIQKYRLEFNRLFGDEKSKKLIYKNFYENYRQLVSARSLSKIQTFANLFQIQNAMDHHKKIESDNNQLEREVLIDELSGLFNRRYLDVVKTQCQYLDAEQDFAIILIDIDYFKEYNDNYGHIEGDEVIRQVAKSLLKYSTNEIVACRYGGDEFYVVCYETTKEKVEKYIIDIMTDLMSKNILHQYSKCSDRVTISIGYYLDKLNKDTNLLEYIGYADRSIYISKRNGRNTFTKYEKGGDL